MSADWPLVTIDSIKADSKGAIAIGPFGSRMKSDCYVEEGIPVIRGTNINDGPEFGGNFVYITKEKADTLGSSNVYQNDLVFPHRGSIGEVGIISEDKRYVLSSSLMKLTCDRSRVNPKFLYYFFKSRIGRNELLKNASQVGTPGIGQPLTSLKGIEFRLPPLRVQDRIEVMLTSLNDKIDLNRQTNQTLEHMAQAIFKSWFVDFEPTRAKIAAKDVWAKRSITAKAGGSDNNIKDSQAEATFVEHAAMAAISGRAIDSTNDSGTGALAGLDQLNPEQIQQLKTTAALFPDVLVDSDLGEIPEGWGVKSLSDYIDVKHGYAFKGEYFSDEATDNILLTPGNFKVGGGLKLNKLKYYDGPMPEGYILKRNDLLVTMTDLSKESDTLGFPALVSKVGNFTFLHNQRLGKIISKDGELKKYFLYFLLKSYNYRSEIVGGATGTTVKHTAPKKILAFTHPFQSDLASEFDVIACALYSKIEGNFNNSEVLKKLRDALLPKLLSGDLNVEGDCHEFR
jgi:type I restriction enzyme S subunit